MPSYGIIFIDYSDEKNCAIKIFGEGAAGHLQNMTIC